MNLSRSSQNRNKSRGYNKKTKTDGSMINPIMEDEFDSVMSKILDPMQYKKQK